MKLQKIRSKFLDFFRKNGHYIQHSYPLVPQDDKTLLFIVAGMVPFKDYFSGLKTPPHTRFATSQKCIRTNDIENVGKTARHASFFEMLGNFSFGDYFKEDAIKFAWEFVTKELKLDLDKVWVSVYEEDNEAYEIWKKQGIDESKIVRMGKDSNFWEIGTGVGPCGPCSELYFDRGEKYDKNQQSPKEDGDRFVEFWNLVFTEFEKQKDGTTKPLKKKNIDTGMGLERIACIMQGVDSIYDVDAFKTIIKEIEKQTGLNYKDNEKNDISMRIITDHIRAVTFLICDGVIPSSEGRGYVLRMFLRRASCHLKKLGISKPFLSELSDVVIKEFEEAYTELKEKEEYIKTVISIEEEKFDKTLHSGMILLEKWLNEQTNKELSASKAFMLYDTYGFPLDLTKEISLERGISVDEEGFRKAMQEQKERSRENRTKVDTLSQEVSFELGKFTSEFVGYTTTTSNSKIISILKDGDFVTKANSSDIVDIVLDKTPFYAESGGQISDSGTIYNDHLKLEIKGIKKLSNGVILHSCLVKEGFVENLDLVKAQVDVIKRNKIKKNHTATHLLHQALVEILGDFVTQAGSYVCDDYFRFDFTYKQALTKEQLDNIEKKVNNWVFYAKDVVTEILDIQEAVKTGAKHLFSEKYGEKVRVVTIKENNNHKPISSEFCGGTHCFNTSEIGIFKIRSESAVSSGVRRIEAITGETVYNYLLDIEKTQADLANICKTQKGEILNKINSILEENKTLQKAQKTLQNYYIEAKKQEILKHAITKNSLTLIAYEFSLEEQETLKNLADLLTNTQESVVVAFANVLNDKVSFIVKLSKKAVTEGLNAGDIVKKLATICSGTGGGRAEIAQAGAKDITKVKEAIEKLKEVL